VAEQLAASEEGLGSMKLIIGAWFMCKNKKDAIFTV
jgi:hypothetical protein